MATMTVQPTTEANLLPLNSEATNYANAATRMACEACNTYRHVTSYGLNPGHEWAALAWKRWAVNAAKQAATAAGRANAQTDYTLRKHWTGRADAATKEVQGALGALEELATVLLDMELAEAGWD